MSPIKDKDEALRQVLRRAYQEREKVEVTDQWQEEVMRRQAFLPCSSNLFGGLFRLPVS